MAITNESETDMIATPDDFAELIQVHPEARLLLVSIIQKRLLAEKSSEIQRLQQELESLSSE